MDMDVSTRRGREHAESTFVPSLAGGSQPDDFDEEVPTTVHELAAGTSDARKARRAALDAASAASAARWFDDDITETTEVTGPPAAMRAMNAPVLDSPSAGTPASSTSWRRRPPPPPAPTRAGSIIIPAMPAPELTAPAPTTAPASPALDVASLFEPAPTPLTPPAPASASVPLPQTWSQAPAPATPAPRAHAGTSRSHAVAAPGPQALDKRRRSISLRFTMTMFLLVCGVLFLHGWDFYVLDLDSRIEHPAYDALRPSGSHGYGYGVSGTVLIFLNLLYLARRRLARANLGSMRTWLDLHVFTGVVGAGFIIFHSAFQIRSPLAITTAAGFGIVLLTGFVGRFLYALAPRPDESVLRTAIAELDSRIPGLRRYIEHAVRAFPILATGATGLLGALATLPAWHRTAQQRRQAIRLVVENAPAMAMMDRKLVRQVRAASRRVERAAALEVRSQAAATLLQSWRSLHRFFALLMLMCVIVHVTMALRYGYHWIFST